MNSHAAQDYFDQAALIELLQQFCFQFENIQTNLKRLSQFGSHYIKYFSFILVFSFQVMSKHKVLCQLFGFTELSGLLNSLTRVQRNRIFKIANPLDKWFRLSDLDISTSFITDYYRTELKIPFHTFSGATGPVMIDGIYLRISKSVISNFIYQIMSALKCICRSVEFGYLFC